MNVKREKFYTSKYCINFISWIRDDRNLFWPPELAFYAMQNESPISFQPKYFFKMVLYTIKICYTRPLYFAQKCPQNARNSILEIQNSKHFQGAMLTDPPTEMYCHFTVRVHGPLPVWNGKAPKWVPVQAS